MTYKPYAGIGSRSTPDWALDIMKAIGKQLGEHGCTLRSGGANGADAAFEEGCGSHDKEIYLPWPNFNDHPSARHNISRTASHIARTYHPAWYGLSIGAKKLMGRNSYQVLGEQLNSPSLFVICWTPKGEGTGGTGQAIRIARDYEIPVFDLGNMETIQDLINFQDQLEALVEPKENINV